MRAFADNGIVGGWQDRFATVQHPKLAVQILSALSFGLLTVTSCLLNCIVISPHDEVGFWLLLKRPCRFVSFYTVFLFLFRDAAPTLPGISPRLFVRAVSNPFKSMPSSPQRKIVVTSLSSVLTCGPYFAWDLALFARAVSNPFKACPVASDEGVLARDVSTRCRMFIAWSSHWRGDCLFVNLLSLPVTASSSQRHHRHRPHAARTPSPPFTSTTHSPSTPSPAGSTLHELSFLFPYDDLVM